MKRFMKDLFESRPIFPKYNYISDVRDLVKANTDDWQAGRNKYLSVGYSFDTVEIILNS